MQLHFINAANNRFYFMMVSVNLFDEYELVISRGSSKRQRPVLKYKHYKDKIDALYECLKLAKRRIKNGYSEVLSNVQERI